MWYKDSMSPTPSEKYAAAAVLFPVSRDWVDPETGHRWIHLPMRSAPGESYGYEEVYAIPRVLEYDGDVFVRTGWNSDKGEMYYRNDMPVAKGK